MREGEREGKRERGQDKERDSEREGDRERERDREREFPLFNMEAKFWMAAEGRGGGRGKYRGRVPPLQHGLRCRGLSPPHMDCEFQQDGIAFAMPRARRLQEETHKRSPVANRRGIGHNNPAREGEREGGECGLRLSTRGWIARISTSVWIALFNEEVGLLMPRPRD